MDERYNHPPNDSPRSGSSKKTTPVIWSAVIAMILLVAIWFAMRA